LAKAVTTTKRIAITQIARGILISGDSGGVYRLPQDTLSGIAAREP